MSDPREEATRNMLKSAMDAMTDVFPGCGVVLLVYPENGKAGERTNYISNCQRKDVIASLREVAARLDGAGHKAPETKQ